MLKCLAILTVLVILAIASAYPLEGQSAPLGSPKERVANTDSGQDTKKQPEADQNKNAPINLTSADVEMVSTPCDEACQQGRRNLEIQGKLEWFTGLLAIVGVLQVGTMIWQAILLKQTRVDVHRQAELMEMQGKLLEKQAHLMAIQTDIQKASLTQWVDIQPVGTIVSTKSKSNPPGRVTLRLRWNLLNNTSLPFTVTRIETHVLKATTEEVNVVEDVEVVPPAREGSRNFYPFFIETDLNKNEAKEFLERGTLLTIQIEISYINASGESTNRFFGEHYWCEKDTLTISGEHLGKTPEKRVEKDIGPSTLRFEEVREIQWTEDDAPETPNPN